MTHKIQFAAPDARPRHSGAVSALRTFILLGVWALVALAGLAVWARLAA